MSAQIALPLAWPVDPGEDEFLLTPSNAEAAALLERWETWPVRTALLVGPPRSGRSLLARIFAARSGGAIIDGAESRPEAELFHAWNRAQATASPLLLVADAAPPAWAVSLADLRSRLAASPVATIGPPDDPLMRALLERLFLRRGLDAREELVDWLLGRVERSHFAVTRVVQALEAAALSTQRRLSIPFARAVLAEARLIEEE